MPELAEAGGLKGYTVGFVTGVGCKAGWFNAYGPRTAWAEDQVDALFAEYDAVVRTYGLRYVDFGFEGAAIADTAANERRSAALARLQQAHPGLKVSFTLPVLPEGLTSEGVAVVKSARDAGMAVDLVDLLAKSDAQLWAMVGVTPMIDENDDHQVYDQADARQLPAFARRYHLGMVSFRDATRDANACTGGSLSTCTDVPQQPYGFARLLGQCAG